MTEFTKTERMAIEAAFSAVRYLIGCTSWADGPVLTEAIRDLRKGRGLDAPGIKAVAVEAWYSGVRNPDYSIARLASKARDTWSLRIMGARHAGYSADDYLGSMIAKARELAPAAIAAKEARMLRAFDELDTAR